jgi:retinol dehydrogenase 12
MSLTQTISEFCPPDPQLTEDHAPNLSGKVYLITGGTSGIGFELAKILYSKNAKVYITSRTSSSAEKAIGSLMAAIPYSKGDLAYVVADFTDLDQVRPAANSFLAREKELHAVWYNAGVMQPPAGSKTKQGYEIQWGTNVVAHFLLSQFLMPVLLATAKTAPEGTVRAVWTSSDGHHLYSPKPDGVDWEDIKVRKPVDWKPSKSSMEYYGQSKAGNILLSKETAARYGAEGLVSVSLNPGHLNTNLNRSIPSWQQSIAGLILHEPRLGALTELYAGLSDEISLENNGAYIIPWGRIGKEHDWLLKSVKNGNGRKLWDFLLSDLKEYL